MKKLLFILLIPVVFFSQEENEQDRELEKGFKKKNEIQINLFDLVAGGTFQIGYERNLKNNQSLGVQLYLLDNYDYYYVGNDKYKSKATSLKTSYNIYFSRYNKFKGFVFYPFMKFRFGSLDIKENYGYGDSIKNYKVNGFSVGFGLGNKWRIVNDRMTLGLMGELSRDLSGNIDYNQFSRIEFRMLVNVGFVF